MGEEEWCARARRVEVGEGTLRSLVLDWLLVEGHSEAACALMQEAGAHSDVDLQSVAERMAIRRAVQAGEIEAALPRLARLAPSLLASNPSLHFRMKQLEAIEMIRHGRIEGAIEYAQTQLAPLVEAAHHLLPELERTMMLLA